MWLMLQKDEADDYVIATGTTNTVRKFCELAFEHVGLDYRNYVKTDSKLFRPAEVAALQGDANKAEESLGWRPTKTFQNLVIEMVEHDLAQI